MNIIIYQGSETLIYGFTRINYSWSVTIETVLLAHREKSSLCRINCSIKHLAKLKCVFSLKNSVLSIHVIFKKIPSSIFSKTIITLGTETEGSAV